jgi:hypothetical protein
MHVRKRVVFETRPTVPSGGQKIARATLGIVMLPLWQYLNDRLYRFMRQHKLIAEWLRLHRLKRITWDECVWWGEPIRQPKNVVG